MEAVAGRIAIDKAVEMRYNLRMLGAPVKGTTILFRDNKSMVQNATLPNSMIKKRKHTNNFHWVQEEVARKIVLLVQ